MSMSQGLLEAVSGYLALGMYEDAWEELENLPPELRADDFVLGLRIEILHRLGKWESARVIAESLAQRSPDNPDWWISWAFALRREQSIEAAQAVLRSAEEIHPDNALIAYNRACYAAVLGWEGEAREMLAKAFAADATLKALALDDPDLDLLFGAVDMQDIPPAH